MAQTTQQIKERLEYLRGELRAERISYGELAELQGLVSHIDPSDTELLEAAGVPEFSKKVRKICDECGSENVNCDAFAQWSVEDQEWQLSSTFDKGSTCDDCDGECRIETATPIDDGETLEIGKKYLFIQEDGTRVFGEVESIGGNTAKIAVSILGEDSEATVDVTACKEIASVS